MKYSSALIYGPGPTGLQTIGFSERVAGVTVVFGNDQDVRTNVLSHIEGGASVRDLSGTDLQDLVSIMDPRIPPTIEEFDAAYPDCEFSEEFLAG